MLGEVGEDATKNMSASGDEVSQETPKSRRSDRPLKKRDSEFEELIRPGSSRSKSSSGSTNKTSDDTSVGDRTPETKRKAGEKRLKKKRRTKSKDKLINEADQKELLDDLEKDKAGEDLDEEKPSHAVVEMRSEDEAEIDSKRADDISLKDRKRGRVPAKTQNDVTASGFASSNDLHNGKSPVESEEELPFYLGHERSMSVDDYNRRLTTPLPPAAPPYDTPDHGDQTGPSDIGTDLAETFIWDPEEHSSNIIIDNQRPNVLTRANIKKSTDGARGSVGFVSGRHEFEIGFKASAWGSHCSVGLCTKHARLQKKGYHDLLGRDKHSWGWDIPSRELLHGGDTLGQWGNHVSDTPTLIGLILDMDAGTLSVSLDGDFKNTETIFKDLDKVNTPLYPAVSTVYPGMEVTIRQHQEEPAPPTLEEEQEGTQEELQGGHATIEPLVPEELATQEPVVERENLSFVGAEKTGSALEEDESDKSVSDQRINDAESGNIDDGAGLMEKGDGATTVDTSFREKADPGTVEDMSFRVDDAEIKENEQDDINENNEEVEEEQEKDAGIAEAEQLPLEMSNSPSKGDIAEEEDSERATESKLDEQQSFANEISPQSETYEFDMGSSHSYSEDFEQLNGGESRLDGTTESTSHTREDFEQLNNGEFRLDGATASSSHTPTYDKENTELNGKEMLQIQEQTEEKYAEQLEENEQTEENYDEQLEENEVTVSSSHSKQSIPLSVSSLPDDDQYALQVALGWDASMKGARVMRYPGVPQICMTEGNFEDKFQGIRGRVTVKSGCHRWRVKEISMFVPQKEQRDPRVTQTPSSLIVGVVDGEHRTFNYGYSLTQIGRHAWGWEPSRQTFWHGSLHRSFPETPDGEEEGSLDIDLKLGLDIMLDCERKTLKFEYQGLTFDASKCYTLFGKEFAPFIVFKGKGRAPVKLEYVSGPEDFIEERLTVIRKLKRIDIEDFVNFRSASMYVTASSNLSLLEEKHVPNFKWGLTSSGVSMTEGGGNEVSFSSSGRQVAISSFPLSSNRHTIDLTFNGLDNLTVGFVGASASQEKLLSNPGLLGSDLHSWAWFVPGGWLVHGGSPIGRYPYMNKDFDKATLSTVRVVLTFSPAGTAVSFAALTPAGSMVDLGVGFINLPPQLWIAVTGNGTSGGNSSVKMVYKSGPTGFVEELQAMTSRVCAIL